MFSLTREWLALAQPCAEIFHPKQSKKCATYCALLLESTPSFISLINMAITWIRFFSAWNCTRAQLMTTANYKLLPLQLILPMGPTVQLSTSTLVSTWQMQQEQRP